MMMGDAVMVEVVAALSGVAEMAVVMAAATGVAVTVEALVAARVEVVTVGVLAAAQAVASAEEMEVIAGQVTEWVDPAKGAENDPQCTACLLSRHRQWQLRRRLMTS